MFQLLAGPGTNHAGVSSLSSHGPCQFAMSPPVCPEVTLEGDPKGFPWDWRDAWDKADCGHQISDLLRARRGWAEGLGGGQGLGDRGGLEESFGAAGGPGTDPGPALPQPRPGTPHQTPGKPTFPQLEPTMLREISQTPKVKHRVVSLTRETENTNAE